VISSKAAIAFRPTAVCTPDGPVEWI
jgi:hypothetical protein